MLQSSCILRMMLEKPDPCSNKSARVAGTNSNEVPGNSLESSLDVGRDAGRIFIMFLSRDGEI